MNHLKNATLKKEKKVAPSRFMFESWDLAERSWWIENETGSKKTRVGAPGVIFYGEPFNYAIVFYRDERTNKVYSAEAVDLNEGTQIVDQYDLALSAEGVPAN